MRSEPFRIESRGVLVKSERLVSQPVSADHHRGRDVRPLKVRRPRREHLTVTGEHNRFGWVGRDVHRHLSPAVVVEGSR